MSIVLRLLVMVGGALASALWAWGRLQHLPEPVTDPADGFRKPPYAGLRTRPHAAAVLGCSVVLATLCACLPGWWTPLAWSLLAGGGCVLALVDLRTTYLPTLLLRPLGIAVALLLLVSLAPAATHAPADAAVAALHMVAGAAASRLLFWCMWRWRAGIGFGDVRLATLLGLVSAAVSPSVWLTGLLLGTLAGAGWALAVVVHRRRHPSPLGTAFAYGPALILGCWAALALSLVAGG